MKKLLLCTLFGASATIGVAQNNGANITGNVESVFQYLGEDEAIGAAQPAEIGLLNSYMNVFYTHGNFKAGMRFESYLPRIQGYPSNFDGTGIGMRYVGYSNDFIDITMGSIYEQFGSGLSLRAYEDRTLGFDNMLDGARVILRPLKGITVKGVYGYQRYQFNQGRIVHGDGIVRGFDGEMNVNQTFDALVEKKLKVTIGGSFVSKYQRDDVDSVILPENVGCYGGRINLRYGKFSLGGEYVIKENDPSTDQNVIFGDINYNNGHAAVINFGYSQKGLGIMLSAKSVDNMSFRSDRNQNSQNLLINFLPSMNKVHTYNLVSSLYPWATQPLGEIAYQAEVLYTIKKGSKLGGKYGTTLNLNASIAARPLQETAGFNPNDSSGITYSSSPFSLASLTHNDDATKAELYNIYGIADSSAGKYWHHKNFFWQDINFSIDRKFSKNLNLKLSYFNIMMNNDVNKVTGFAHGTIISNIGVAEVGYKINKKHSFRAELQGLFINKIKEYETDETSGESHLEIVKNDKGNWVTIVLEYNLSPNWFFSVMDLWNMPNSRLDDIYAYDPESSKSQPSKSGVHHPYISAGYIHGATRVTAGYGRQRAGLFCVGGICRNVPASNGLTLSITHSF